MRYEITLANCCFHAHHGVLAEETALGQRFHLDVVLAVEVPREALERDEVEGTVHYGEAFALVERIVTTTRRDLIETLALDVCRELLRTFPPIAAATVTVRKPAVPIAGILDHAGVTVSLDRSS